MRAVWGQHKPQPRLQGVVCVEAQRPVPRFTSLRLGVYKSIADECPTEMNPRKKGLGDHAQPLDSHILRARQSFLLSNMFMGFGIFSIMFIGLKPPPLPSSPAGP